MVLEGIVNLLSVVQINRRCCITYDTGNGERPWKNSDARLVLEDGSIWRAKSFGASGTQVGEVVFNTSLTGSGNYESWDVSMFYGFAFKLNRGCLCYVFDCQVSGNFDRS